MPLLFISEMEGEVLMEREGVRFENRYHTSRTLLWEYIWHVMCGRMRLWGIVVAAAGAAAAVFAIWQQDVLMTGIFAACGVIAGLTAALCPFLTLRRIEQCSRQLHRGEEPETVIQFADRIYLEEGEVSLAVEYAQIQEVFLLRHCWALMMTRHNGILLEPQSFCVGTGEELIQFLQKKCPDARWHNKTA